MGYSYFGNGTDTPGGPQQSRHVDVVPEALTSDEIIYNPVLEKLVMVFWLRMLRLSGKWWGKSGAGVLVKSLFVFLSVSIVRALLWILWISWGRKIVMSYCEENIVFFENVGLCAPAPDRGIFIVVRSFKNHPVFVIRSLEN